MPPKPDPKLLYQNTLAVFTTDVRYADTLIHLVDDDPSPTAARKLEDLHARLEATYDDLIKQAYNTHQKDVDNTEYKEKLQTLGDAFNPVSRDILKAISSCNKAGVGAAPIPQQPPNPAYGASKPISALKPFKLTRDTKPVELRHWINQFKAYYNTSHFEVYDHVDQQAFFRTCMDPLLYDRIQSRIHPNTPIFTADPDDDSCIKLLKEEFDLEYPIFARRFDFFRASQPKGQAFSDFIAKLDGQAEEADIDAIRIEDIYVFRYICACTDPKLKEKLLKLEQPTRRDIRRLVRNYEVTETNLKATLDTVKANKASGKNKPQRQSSSKDKGDSDRNAREYKRNQNLEHLKGKCFRCAEEDHSAYDCPLKNKICNYCSKKGHVKAACSKHYRDKKKSASHPGSSAHSRATCAETNRDSSASRDSSTSRGFSASPQPPAASSVTRAFTRRTVSRPTPRINVNYKVGNINFQFPSLPDTGATRTIISHSLLKKHAIPISRAPDEMLYAANEKSMAVEGCVHLQASIGNDDPVTIDALITSDMSDEILISWHDLIALRIIS